jgi:hypothetical protein
VDSPFLISVSVYGDLGISSVPVSYVYFVYKLHSPCLDFDELPTVNINERDVINKVAILLSHLGQESCFSGKFYMSVMT